MGLLTRGASSATDALARASVRGGVGRRVSLRRAACAVIPASIALLAAPCRADTARAAFGPPAHADVALAELQRVIAASKGRPVVLNVWATWCIPCREEFPHLVALEKEFRDRGIRFLSVSVDSADAYEAHAKPFLAELGVPFPVWRRADGDDQGFINALDGSWQGDLPAVFLFTGEGRLLKRLSGEHTREDLRREIAALLA